jgi:antitoxin YefM
MLATTLARLQKDLKLYLDRVISGREVLIVPQGDGEDDAVVIMSLHDYNALVETGYLLNDEANRARLLDSIKQLNEDDTVGYNPED